MDLPPVVAWFNPDAEGEVLAESAGRRRQPNAMVQAMEHDLEILSLAWCGPGDIAAMRQIPSTSHLARLRRSGFAVPEIIPVEDLASLAAGPVGGIRPWAWSPEAAAMLRPLAGSIPNSSRWPWQPSLPPGFLSKELGWLLGQHLGSADDDSVLCRDQDSATAALRARLRTGPALLKAAHACSGRGHFRVTPEDPFDAAAAWIRQTLADHPCLLVESWLESVTDFSALYESDETGTRILVGMSLMENDSAGRFRGTQVAVPWDSLLDPAVAAFLDAEARASDLFSERIPKSLDEIMPDYSGPVGVDAMIHRRPGGSLALRAVVEVNARMSMGRVALDLFAESGSPDRGHLRILRRREWNDAPGWLPLNDPSTAREFVAAWSTSRICERESNILLHNQ